MSDRTATPFIHPEGRVKTTISTVISIVVITAAGVAAWTWARAEIIAEQKTNLAQEVQLSAIDLRVRNLESDRTDIAVMKNDVQWIRRTIEQQQKAR